MAEESEYNNLLQEIQENLRISESEENESNEKDEHDEKDDFRNDDFEIVTGFRDGSKLLYVPGEKCFYKQNAFSKTHDGMAYTCYDGECTARKVLKNNGAEIMTLNAAHIPHLSMDRMYKELYYLNLMKHLCRTESHSVSVSQIYERVQAM